MLRLRFFFGCGLRTRRFGVVLLGTFDFLRFGFWTFFLVVRYVFDGFLAGALVRLLGSRDLGFLDNRLCLSDLRTTLRRGCGVRLETGFRNLLFDGLPYRVFLFFFIPFEVESPCGIPFSLVVIAPELPHNTK